MKKKMTVDKSKTSNYISRNVTNITENHGTRIAFKKKLDAKILESFLSYKAKIYRFHRKLLLIRPDLLILSWDFYTTKEHISLH